MKTKKPSFKRQHSSKKRVEGKGWRHPRGIDSAQRQGFKSRGARPKVGYGTPKNLKGLHPTGVREILVKTMKDLSVAGEGAVVRLYSKLGKKKREELRKKAEEMKIKVLN